MGIEKLQENISRIYSGNEGVIEKLIIALLSGGHVLIEDVPGVGKTTVAKTLASSVKMDFARVQFTPDTLPTDILGTSVFDAKTESFRVVQGPIFHQFLLADEINRTSPKTQSALLEAMEERQATVDANVYPMEKPFMVIATENSVGTAGTQLLPYAQMDRFMLRLSLGYPSHDAQMEMLRARQQKNPLEEVRCVLSKDELLKMQSEVTKVTSKDAILDYITHLTMASRVHEAVEIGISPRGALFLDRAAKAKAYIDGRDYVTGPDVQAVFKDVCAHRVLLKADAAQSVDQVLDALIGTTPTPDRHGFRELFGK